MNNMLLKIIRYASENVPFYSELFNKNNIEISDLDNLIEDIKKYRL